MTEPTIKIELTLHPEASDGQPNAWKVEMTAADGTPLLIATGSNVARCLRQIIDFIEKRQYLAFAVPEAVARMAGGTYFDGYQLRDAETKRAL